MTAEELLRRAAACQDCGKAHEYRWVTSFRATWAASDGHAYRPLVDENVVALLRYLATGRYENQWHCPRAV